MKEVIFGEVKRIVISYKDLIIRFESNLIKQICFFLNVEKIGITELFTDSQGNLVQNLGKHQKKSAQNKREKSCI